MMNGYDWMAWGLMVLCTTTYVVLPVAAAVLQ